MSDHAVVILTARKTRQLTSVSRKISPTQRVDTDGNTQLRGDTNFVRVPAKHKSRTTRHADPETTEGLRADPPTNNVDSHTVVCSWCTQIPRVDATSGSILPSRLSICGAKAQELESRSPCYKKIPKNKEEHGAKVTPYECTDGCSGEEIPPIRYCVSCSLLTTTLSALFGHLLRIRLGTFESHDLPLRL